MSEKGKKSTQYKNRYNRENYDALRIVVPKGRKEAIEAHAQSIGKSINSLVNGLLREDMGFTSEEWEASPPEAGKIE